MAHRRIDVHHHIVPPAYAEWLASHGLRDAGGRELPAWSVEEALATMDEHDIASAVVSISTPGVHLRAAAGPDLEAHVKAREMNELAARLVQDHPRRFGFFATLPVRDVDAALEEIAYAYEALHAWGVVLLANVQGRYLGEPEYEPLFEELARRQAIAFVHPSELPAPRVDGIPPFAADFLLDTTRAAFLLVRNGVVRRHPSIRFILSHAGGFVPYASHRLAAAMTAETPRSPLEILEDFASFYFDTALSGSPAALPSLLAFAKPGHVLFGSDWPYAPSIAVDFFTSQLDAYAGLDAEGHAAIDHGNAEALFPELAGKEKA
jgi:predicted TIM-barrel fold metal-dependent hydrolase